MTSVAVVLIVATVGPAIESAVWPAARGELLEWRDAGAEIEIVEARVRKRGSCEYLNMYARAGAEDLPIRFDREFGSRPGGEFVLQGVYIDKPAQPGPIDVWVSVDHRCNPLWISRSRLFRIEYR